MGIPNRHILQQGPVLAALGRTAFFAMRQRLGGTRPSAGAPLTPGPEVYRSRPPLPRKLIDDYIEHVGGDRASYRDEVPPHLFPQWCMPAVARCLEGLPYPLLGAVNGGCRVRVDGRIPDNEGLEVRARLQDIDENDRRVVLHQRLTTGARSRPDALSIDFYTIVPLARGRNKSKTATAARAQAEPSAEKEKPRVPAKAREIKRTERHKNAGLAFAKLTGDFNPIHWLAPYARISGFPNVIQHGFASLAICWEALAQQLCGGDVHAIETVDVKLSRPLVLPRDVGIYVLDREMFVGDAPGELAYLTGSFSARGVS
jgi:acyl dehydratase